MKAVSNKNLAIGALNIIGLLLIACCLSLSCSIPNLEPTSCIDARTAIREFYSFHFGNDMGFSQENLKQREKFLTPEFAQRLSGWTNPGDPFTTGNEDLPKAFRVGACKEISAGRTEFEVLLFWRDDVRSEQGEIKVEAEKQNDRWLIGNVSTVGTK